MDILTRSRSRDVGTSAAPFPAPKSMASPGDPPLRLAPNGSGRRPAMAVMSIAVVATCSALFALIYVHSSRLVSVIAVTHQITQGELIEASDLRQVDVALAGGVTAVPVSDAAQVIGRPASVTLLVGALLSPADVGGAQELASGQSVVGVDLKPGMLPASGVQPGEPVLVVLTGPTGSPVTSDGGTNQSGKSATGGQSVVAASVVGVNDAPDDSGAGDVVVSVEVPVTSASLIAGWSAAGQAALVQIGGSP